MWSRSQPESCDRRSLNGYPIIGVPTDLDKVIADYARHGVRIDKVVVAERSEELSGTAWNEIVRICTARQIGLEVQRGTIAGLVARPSGESPNCFADESFAARPLNIT